MLYFFIFPVFVGLLIVLTLAAIVTRLVPTWSHVSPYLFSGTIGFAVGFIIANVLNFLVGLASGLVLKGQNVPDAIRQIINFISAIILFLGPVPASVIGAVIGFVLGILLVHRRRRSLLA